MLTISAYTVRSLLSHKLMYVGLPSLTPIDAVSINNSKLIYLAGFFAGEKKFVQIDRP